MGLFVWLTGCDRAPRYDQRLVQADSLMQPDPDSALAIVEAVNRDSLADEGDRAYRDLLLTQARYRCYIVATSDSDINRALSFYRRHSGEREKLTRAYIYKGAVMDELGHPDSAMYYYKYAEATAAPDDYFNLGYVKMRMGALYSSYYSMDGKEIEKYEEALKCFKHTRDTTYLYVCINNLGCLYRETNADKAESLLLEASSLARKLNDTLRIIDNKLALIVLYRYNQRYLEARQLIRDVASYEGYVLDDNLCFTASAVYARLGILDTAQMYFNLATQNRSGDETLYKMHYLACLGELALARRDSASYLKYSMEGERIADSIKVNVAKLSIIKVDDGQDKEFMLQHQNKHARVTSFYKWMIAVVMAGFILLTLFHYRKAHRYKRFITDLKEECINHSDNLETLKHNIRRFEIDDLNLKDSLASQLSLMSEIIEECYHAPNNILSQKIRQLIKYQERNKTHWTRLYPSIDSQYNNIISYTKKNYPNLNEKELLMIALTCLGFTCAQIAIILDYSNAAGISTIRKRISTKMGLDGSLMDYIEQFKSGIN